MLLTALLGCQHEPASPPAPAQAQPSAPQPAASASTAPTKGARIASLSTFTTRMLDTLGVGDRIVAVSAEDAHPAAAGRPRVGSERAPSLDAVLAAKPDLVVGLARPEAESTFWGAKSNGLALTVVRSTTLADLPAAWRRLGDAVGEAALGDQLADEFIAGVDNAVRRSDDTPGPTAIVILRHTPLMVAGAGSYGEELIQVNGAVNVAAAAQPEVAVWSPRLLTAAAPQVVFDASPGRADPATAAAFKARFPALPAVVLGQVYPAPRSFLSAHLDAADDVAWVAQMLQATDDNARAVERRR